MYIVYVLYSSSVVLRRGQIREVKNLSKGTLPMTVITRERAQNRLGEFNICANLRDAFVRFACASEPQCGDEWKFRAVERDQRTISWKEPCSEVTLYIETNVTLYIMTTVTMYII
ncbi:hypothetical protein NP493_744g01007 [Ridgeia piscesae]|uniref:Uncharacterized protein n=1 Tax=Ridgeia piscesae TaxID=27915 RepID=A0AAD9NQ12_RIDPI|nr:hypothetical protein NP493_744g01007 [Ridgeia piscesae]